MKLRAVAQSVVGGREMNQDSFLVNIEKGLFAVADGIGGGVKGEVASQMAVERLNRFSTDADKRLFDVFERIQKEIYDEAMATVGEPIMGTTLTAARISESCLYVTHIGDSRCYLLQDSLLKMLTEDHEFFDEKVGGPVLASYLGMPRDILPMKIFQESQFVKPGDVVLLCSDGLYKQLSETEIVARIQEPSFQEDPQLIANQLCADASKKEYSDNVTVILIQILE